jgi:site-specific DNA-methyltransferase (adenine-specific)
MKIIKGDCLSVLKTLADNSIDAIVTDPPAGIGFMNKEWDDFRRARNTNDANRANVFGRTSKTGPEYGRGSRDNFIAWLTERMAECLRVLKPGGHMLVWAIPRTSHWTATALEDAGFEVRDRVSHIFGTGFPKVGNISKQIDKAAGAKRTILGKNPNARPIDGSGSGYTGATSHDPYVTAPATDEAKKWDGWGTALKPACEDWWLVRKPFKGPVYKNVMKYGTGALNIDATRVTTADKLTRKLGKSTESDSGWKSVNRSEIAGKDGGRWPANITFDEAAAEMLDAQSGITKSGAMKSHVGAYEGESVTGFLRGASGPHNQHGDEGGASRFFYTAKASKKEKNAGVDGSNTHPTVKSQSLMRWLVRLITPPKGVVLDPFCGSGSTGVACVYEGFDFIGIEAEEEYAEIAERRIKHAVSAAGEDV